MMVFVENLVGGMATALGYLVVFGLLSVVTWKVGSKLYGKYLNQMLQAMTARPTTATDPDTERCDCGGASYKRYPYCPWCGVKRQVEP